MSPTADIYRSVIKLRYEESPSRAFLGSGVVISADGFVLTNNHVIENLNFGTAFGEITAYQLTEIDEPPTCTYPTELLVRNDQYDLAILKLADFHTENFVSILEAPVFSPKRIEEQIRVVGYPGLGGETLTVTRGIVSGFDQDKNLKTDAEINHGNSGGAAFDAQNEFIGIPTFVISDQTGKIGFIIPVGRIREWLNATLKSGLPKSGRAIASLFDPNNIDYEKNLDSGTNTPRILAKYALVEALLTEGRYEEVFTQISFILNRRPNSPLAYHYRGNAYLGLQQYECARQAYRRSLAFDPYYVPALGNSAIALCELGRHSEALQAYEEILAITDSDAEKAIAFNNTGRIHESLGNGKVARDYYEQALSVDPNCQIALKNIARLTDEADKSSDANCPSS